MRVIRTPIRKIVFQLHLWLGILLGFYVVVVCASGSALVFRNDIYDWLETGGKAVAYKGSLYHCLSWLGKLHGSLLMESGGGMTANAVGGFLLAALCLTGIIVWWRSSALAIRRKAGWRSFIFDLHGVLGFWTFAVLLMWGLTGGYFVFPDPFRAVVNFFAPIGATRRILRGFSFAHYGNFAGWEVKLLWVILGLAPAALFSTALVMWYNRVLAPALRRLRHDARSLIGRP